MARLDLPPDSDFDLRARAELSLAYEPGEVPEHLLRHTPWHAHRGVRAGVAASLLIAACFATLFSLRPPEIVREAIEHEYFERTLRGNFMPERDMLAHMGLADAKSVPGFPQLMRPCEIDDRLVYHLTTFVEKGGMVTVFSFDQPVPLREGAGWWSNVHWQVVTGRDGRPLLLVSQQAKAIAAARSAFARPPA
jgi:hypothetical protein